MLPVEVALPAAVVKAQKCRGVTAKGFPCPAEAAVGRYCEACTGLQSPVRRRTAARISPLGVVLLVAFVYTLYKLVTTGIYVRLLDF